MIPLLVPDLSGNEKKYLGECIETGFVSSVGPFVAKFEKMVSEASGAESSVATASGTAGLHVALKAVGVRRGDLVILPSFTFIASANAISYCGADPWLFDISPLDWSLDPALLQKYLENETKRAGGQLVHKNSGRRVSAIMPIHALGTPADMDPIVAIARTFDLPVIADGAAALGCRYRGRPVGALGADLTVFSFNGNKTVTCGGGGAVVGNGLKLLDRIRHLTTTARCPPEYDHDEIGFNYRMTNIQAAVGCAQMERLDQIIASKRSNGRAYDKAFQKISGLTSFPQPEWTESSCWLLGAMVDSPGKVKGLRDHLQANGIDSRPFWKPMHLQSPYKGVPRTPLPICNEIWMRMLTLPSSSGLTEEDRTRTIATLEKALVNRDRL